MRKFYYLLAVVAVAATSCQQEVTYTRTQPEAQNSEIADPQTRSYEEALAIAEEALKLVDGEDTRSSNHRVIKRNEGQVVMRSTTRGGETEEEPVMYIFNNEENEGFTVVAANRGVEPIIAVTERGNYTYGEPTGVESFDKYMDDVVETYSTIVHPPIVLPDDPIVPSPGFYIDTVLNRKTVVSPIITTKWGQDGIYGKYCPNGLSGCSITALVQILAHHEYPVLLQSTYNGTNTNINLNWDNMLQHTESADLNTTCDCGCDYEQIAFVMREMGYRAGTRYYFDNPNTDVDERGSGNTIQEIYTLLISLGYNNVIYTPTSNFSDEFNTIVENLNNDCPIYIRGVDSSGHAWVLDGYSRHEVTRKIYVSNPNYNPNIIYNPEPQYILDRTEVQDTKLLHFNWGWDGNCDGWFSYGCFQTNNAETYDDTTENNDKNRNYCNDIGLIYHIDR